MTHRFKHVVGFAAVAGLMLTSSGSAMQTSATGTLMRQKLTHAQRVLEALTTSDYALLERESAELARATTQPGWMVLKTPEYRKQSEAFLKATDRLVAAARQRDLDAAARHYTELAMTCYQCHRHMKDMRIVR